MPAHVGHGPVAYPVPAPCDHTATDKEGDVVRMCREHALGAIKAVPDVTVAPPLH